MPAHFFTVSCTRIVFVRHFTSLQLYCTVNPLLQLRVNFTANFASISPHRQLVTFANVTAPPASPNCSSASLAALQKLARKLSHQVGATW
jgi:hypothetical protein